MTAGKTVQRRAAGVVAMVCLASAVTAGVASLAQRNGPLPGPLPLFPADNWWNQDISQAPVDSRSAEIIAFIGGPSRGMHPDFGGTESPGSHNIYGMPYVVVGQDQPKVAVQFQYASESDGVNHQTGQSYPFYPIPEQAITEPYWIEGGPPGNAGVGGDRHMLIVDRDRRHLYELFALRWAGGRWEAGSGAFFDLNTNARRPEGWTSADAAGLAILPGLVRYDEVFGPDEIRHAFRVTVNGVRNYVWPASHRANTSVNGPPLGTRLRLKPGVNLSGYPPYLQKIFRAMKTHGLIVADTGSSLFVSGVFDTRWNNGELNPAFRSIKASDFEVIQLGWRGAACQAPGAPALTGSTAGTAVALAWTPASGGGTVSGYVLEAGRSPGGSDVATLPLGPSVRQFNTSAAPGTYYARVRATNACGSAVSNEVTLVASSSCVLPGTPGAPVASVANGRVSLSWAAGSGATHHILEAGSLPGRANLVNHVTNGTALSTGMPPQGTYFVRTRALNACGTSAASPETMVAIGCAVPGSPSPLQHTVEGRRVRLSWAPVSGATSYVVEAGSSPGAWNIASLPVGGTEIPVDAPPGTYYVRVRAVTACGSGPWSNEARVEVGAGEQVK